MKTALRGPLAGASLALSLCACGATAPPTPVASAPLGGAIARVAGLAIPPSFVSDAARSRGATPREALAGLVEDALAAQGAQARGFDRDPEVAWLCAAALARRVPIRLIQEATALGAPTDDELALVSVVHAVVLRSPNLGEDEALAIAASIRRAVVGSSNPDEFEARASAVNHPHAQVRVERIGPFGADGKSADGSEFEPAFVAAAFALRAPRDTSPIIATPFGWHVLQLVERASGDERPEERRAALAEPVVQMRGRIRLQAIVLARRQSAQPEVSVAADELMSLAVARP